MWYYNAEIIKTPRAINIGGFKYSPDVFNDADKLTELGIRKFSITNTPNSRYFSVGTLTVDTSKSDVTGTYGPVAKDSDKIKEKMLEQIKSQLTKRLENTDWYYLRKLRTGADVPSDIQNYSDALYAEYDSKKTEISAMTKLSQIMEYENRPHTEVRKVKNTDENGKTTYGPKTYTNDVEINMCNHWTSSPDDEVDPAFVSLTAD